MDRAYKEFDREGKGEFTYEELADHLLRAGAVFAKETLISLAEDIDTDDDGRISKVTRCQVYPFRLARIQLILVSRVSTQEFL